jgi:parallel beta-helix repeat protein
VRDNVISNNSQAFFCGGQGGGGILITGVASAQILGNVISGNSTRSDGGGISLFAAGAPIIRGNTISGNRSGSQGGGISLFNQSDADIIDNVIVGNSGVHGGGIGWLVPSCCRGPFVVNNTIVDNAAADGASGILADGFDVNAQIANNIVVALVGQNAIHCGNFTDLKAPAIEANDVVAAAPGLGYAGICADQTGKNGNVSVDPLFVDRAGGDFHLQLASPVIDAGTNAAPALPSLDRDGNSRVVDGNADRVATVDMGAYEVSLAPALTIAPASISFADQVVGTTSAAQVVTLTNPGSRAVPIFSTVASGDFAETSHCGRTLAGGANCTIEVRFAPTHVGARAGAISATYAAANSPQAVPLSGNGIEPSRLVTFGRDGGGCSQGGSGGWLALLVAVAEARRLVGRPTGRDSRTRP